jgi:hypothetical protein
MKTFLATYARIAAIAFVTILLIRLGANWVFDHPEPLRTTVIHSIGVAVVYSFIRLVFAKDRPQK